MKNNFIFTIFNLLSILQWWVVYDDTCIAFLHNCCVGFSDLKVTHIMYIMGEFWPNKMPIQGCLSIFPHFVKLLQGIYVATKSTHLYILSVQHVWKRYIFSQLLAKNCLNITCGHNEKIRISDVIQLSQSFFLHIDFEIKPIIALNFLYCFE